MLEHHEAFPARCNIEFAHLVEKDTLRTRVWERGSGITMACGTGACATAVAAAKLGVAGCSSKVVMDGARSKLNGEKLTIMFILLAVPNLCLTARYRFPDKVADISINQIR